MRAVGRRSIVSAPSVSMLITKPMAVQVSPRSVSSHSSVSHSVTASLPSLSDSESISVRNYPVMFVGRPRRRRSVGRCLVGWVDG